MMVTLGIGVTSVALALIYGIIFETLYPSTDILDNSGLITLCAFCGLATTILAYAIIRVLKGGRLPAK
jgi:hypothetical protein